MHQRVKIPSKSFKNMQVLILTSPKQVVSSQTSAFAGPKNAVTEVRALVAGPKKGVSKSIRKERWVREE